MHYKKIYFTVGVIAIICIGIFAWFFAFPSDKGELSSLVSPALSDTILYTHVDPTFSFEYPSSFTAAPIEEGSGETILLQAKDNPESSFQIYISPFDENIVLDEARIKKDLPNLVVENPGEILISEKTKAVSFTSANNLTISSREVWFVYDGFLYQISAPLESEASLEDILKSWNF